MISYFSSGFGWIRKYRHAPTWGCVANVSVAIAVVTLFLGLAYLVLDVRIEMGFHRPTPCVREDTNGKLRHVCARVGCHLYHPKARCMGSELKTGASRLRGISKAVILASSFRPTYTCGQENSTAQVVYGLEVGRQCSGSSGVAQQPEQRR